MAPVDPDSLYTGLLVIGTDGCIHETNQAAADFLGRSPASLRGTALESADAALARWSLRLTQGHRSFQAPEAALSSTGQATDAVFTRIDDGILIELHPVAERLRQRQLADRADQQQAIHMLSRRLAHELRNPLAGVRAAAQLIGGQTSEPALRRHADMIQREVDRITGLIERFAGERDNELAPVNLHRILEETGELVVAERHGRLDLIRDFDPSIPRLMADGARLHQLVLNLVRNAVQAEAGSIRLVTRIEHDSPMVDRPARHAVRIEVLDDGHGVPEALRDRLFLPLVSGRDQGSGFGLAIVQQIARAHGGLVEYLPRSPGSAFIVRLPLIAAEETDHD
ncbi:MAG: two-component system sensor histidine kinase NtrB [Wenzhouxiangella sp.]